jgi:hypothetical protein
MSIMRLVYSNRLPGGSINHQHTSSLKTSLLFFDRPPTFICWCEFIKHYIKNNKTLIYQYKNNNNKRFCSLKGHEMFCHVERAYIEDGFNLYGLRACVSNYSDCLDLILDRIGPEDSDDSHLTQSACMLYGLIHARYIVTTHGLDSMYNKVS